MEKKYADESDDEPETISFATSKLETVDNMQRIKDQVSTFNAASL
jgi:hypothetical protein